MGAIHLDLSANGLYRNRRRNLLLRYPAGGVDDDVDVVGDENVCAPHFPVRAVRRTWCVLDGLK